MAVYRKEDDGTFTLVRKDAAVKVSGIESAEVQSEAVLELVPANKQEARKPDSKE